MGNLTGKELVEKGIITGNIPEENVSQHGVDLNLIRVQKIIGVGIIPVEGKTILAEKEEIKVDKDNFYQLGPGSYDVTFDQGCNIPSDKMGLIRQRSSLLRNGVILHSSCFDAGFATENIGSVIIVPTRIVIEHNARIGQMYTHNSNEVKNLYDGQYQGDKQRKDEKK